jgi:hypothetical protein
MSQESPARDPVSVRKYFSLQHVPVQLSKYARLAVVRQMWLHVAFIPLFLALLA